MIGNNQPSMLRGPLVSGSISLRFAEVLGKSGEGSSREEWCGPIFDLSLSEEYNLCHVRIVQWFIFMIEADRLQSFLVAPPCASFSGAAHPCVRTYRLCRGLPGLPSFKQFKVWLGNKLRGATSMCLIQGQLTRSSATYTDLLAEELAGFFHDHLIAVRRARGRLALSSSGLENILTNDLCLSLCWEEKASFRWKGASHINLLETAATLRLFRDVAARGGDCRFTYLGDSRVSRSALARGRTSSRALRGQLKQSCRRSVPRLWTLPWWLNAGDPPSRFSSIPPPVALSLRHGLSSSALTALAMLPPTKRWTSNWLRLVLLLAPSLALLLTCSSECRRHPWFCVKDSEWSLDFDCALGYPGEGLPCQAAVWFILLKADV